MSADPNKKSARTFQCRDVLWETFEQMARELECSIDYLVNEAMKQYARQRSYGGGRSPLPGQRPDQGSAHPSGQHQAVQQQPAPPPAPPAPPPMSATPPPVPQRPSALPPPPPKARPSFPPQAPGGGGRPPLPPPPSAMSAPPPMPGYPPAPAARPLPAPPPPMARPAPPPMPGPPMPGGGGMPPMPGNPMQTMQMGRPSAPPPLPTPRPLSGQMQAPPPMQQAPMPSAMPNAGRTLVAVYGPERVAVTKDRFIIGRGKQTSDLTIKDPNVSRQHAMVEFLNGQYYMVDMGSTNGVEYLGQRIARKVIAEGDVYRICDHEVRFTYQ